MKAGILTFHGANNYGAVLQAYALTQWLQAQGVEAEIVNYRSRVYDKYRLFRTQQYRRTPYKLAVDLVKYPEKKRRNRHFDAFRAQFLPVSRQAYRTPGDFRDIQDQYDCFICGSDQIWNPELTKGFDPIFFLDFVSDPAKKVAFAPSVAVRNLSEGDIATIVRHISSFGALSIRERETIDLLQPRCEKTIHQTCDPVFLPDRRCYDAICSERYSGKKYVFLYIVGRAVAFKNVIAYAEKLSAEKHLELYYLVDGDKALYRISGKNVFGCSPADFLSLVRHADCVISNSFHATAFSILFCRQFFTFLKEGTGSRMVNLLKAFQLENRIIGDDNAKGLEGRIDYSRFEGVLEDYRRESVEYLVRAMGL